jgi:hypothetical protein
MMAGASLAPHPKSSLKVRKSLAMMNLARFASEAVMPLKARNRRFVKLAEDW